MSDLPAASVIIPVRNDPVRLRACLAAVARAVPAGTRLERVVADNGSTDGTPDVARASGAQLLSLPGLTVSEVRNRAAAASAGPILAFIDADHEIADGWISAALEAIGGDRVGAAGALYLAPDDGSWVQRMYGALRGRTSAAGDVPWLGSGNLVVRREAFEAVHGFDASLTACEDVDLCQRLRAAGWRVVADPRLRSVHHGDPPTLRALFRAERWRGRDNIRVSLRGPLSLRDLPSVVTPILDVLAALTFVGATVALPVIGAPAWPLAVGALLLFAGLAALRGIRIAWRTTGGPLAWLQAMAVAATYDAARAAALLTSAPHHRHHQARESAAGAGAR